MSLWVTEERQGFQRKPSTLNLQWKLIIHGSKRWQRHSANTQTTAISATPTKVTKPYTNMAAIMCEQQANICVKKWLMHKDRWKPMNLIYIQKSVLMALLSPHRGSALDDSCWISPQVSTCIHPFILRHINTVIQADFEKIEMNSGD